MTAADFGPLDDAIRRRMPAAVDLLKELVACRSVNPLQPGIDPTPYLGGEAAANRVLEGHLQAVGLETHQVAVEPDRPNLVGVLRGTGGGRSLAFNAHIDTVAPQHDEAWDVREEGGRLFGLGATDMKAGHAAVWLALAALRDAGVEVSGDVQLHSVVGEETMSHELGTSAVIGAGFRTDAVVVAEPTCGGEAPAGVYNSAAGNALFHIDVRGKSTHWVNRARTVRAGGEGDEVGVNALEKAVYVYQAVRQLEEQWAFSKRHPAFPPGAFVIHPGVFRADVGFAAAPYFPDRARIDYLLSFPPGETFERIKDEVEAHVETACALDPWLRANPPEFGWIDTWPPQYTSPEDPFVQSVLAARRRLSADDPSVPDIAGAATASYQSDAAFYEAAGIPAAVCGPGDISTAHAAEESVEVAMVELLARMYVRLIVDWCA